MSTMPFKTRALHESFGAEILDIKVTELNADGIDELRQLWIEQPLLLVRNQLIKESDLVELSRQFGELEVGVRIDTVSSYYPEVSFLSNLLLPNGKMLGALGHNETRWHTDQSYRERPATGAIFYALEVPLEDGETSWANTQLAYEALDAEMRASIEGRRGLFGYMMYDTDITDEEGGKAIRDLTPDVAHPMVIEHPLSGARSVYVDPTQTFGIEGMAPEESKPLLDRLKEHVLRAEFIYTHPWRMGDLMFWDNGRLLHHRNPFDPNVPRLSKRTTIYLPPNQFPCPYDAWSARSVGQMARRTIQRWIILSLGCLLAVATLVLNDSKASQTPSPPSACQDSWIRGQLSIREVRIEISQSADNAAKTKSDKRRARQQLKQNQDKLKAFRSSLDPAVLQRLEAAV